MRFMSRMALGFVAAALAAFPGPAAAQPPPTDPVDEARIHAGPFHLRPTLTVSNIGTDSNIFNEAEDPKEDFTATITPRLELITRFGPGRLTAYSSAGFVYFQTFKEQQSVNRAFGGRFELLFSRLRPFVDGEAARTRERPNAEIDARAWRTHNRAGAGTALLISSRTALVASATISESSFLEGERFRGFDLGEQLNQTTEAAAGGIRLQLTPFTAISIIGEAARERFERSPFRDADSLRVAPIIELSPRALISGRASVGWRRFRPRSEALPPFDGLVADVGLGYTMLGTTSVLVRARRDTRHSFRPERPYYVTTGGSLEVIQRVVGGVDVSATAGREQFRYRALAGLEVPDLDDRVDTMGAGIGYRLGDGTRFSVNVDYTERFSDAADRRYDRLRIFGAVSYGFERQP